MDSMTGRSAHRTLADRVRDALTGLRDRSASRAGDEAIRAEFRGAEMAPGFLLTRMR
jgi:hypothetical protein